MSLTLTHEPELSRVRLAGAGLADGTVRVERSFGGVLWETVRGGARVRVVDGEFTLFDYEFHDRAANVYRVVATESPQLRATSGAASGTTGFYTVAAPAGLVAGDLLLAFQGADIGSLADMTAPDGGGDWRLLAELDESGGAGLHKLWARTADSEPVEYTFFQDSGADGVCALAAVQSATGDDPVLAVMQRIKAATVATPGITPAGGADLELRWAFTEPDTSSTTWTLPGELDEEQDLNSGGFASGVLGSRTLTSDQRTGALSATASDGVAGGAGWTVAVTGADMVVEQESITPALEAVWLKSIDWPMLNRAVDVVPPVQPSRGGRGQVHEVSGRSLPVAQQELHASPAWTLQLITHTRQAERDLDLVLAAGGTRFLHVPKGADIPGGYLQIGDAGHEPTLPSQRSPRRVWTLQCRVVAPPGPDVVGGTLTFGTLLRLYGNLSALLAAHPSYRDLAETVGDPEDALVL